MIIIISPSSSSSPWEDPDQRVSPELLILTAPTGGGQPKVGERASQENVRDLDLERVHDEQYNPLSWTLNMNMLESKLYVVIFQESCLNDYVDKV